MKTNYKHTLVASYIGYIVQALVINLIPLLFVSFSENFNISLTKLGVLIFINFGIQLTIDLVAAKYVSKIGYRNGAVLAHILAFSGLILLGILPYVIDSFTGIAVSMFLTAAGGGFTEVMISPIVQSLPLKNKAAHMSVLHSFYCWGSVLTILLSTLYFAIFGVESWRYLPMLWSIVAFVNIFIFAKAPIIEEYEQGEKNGAKTLLKKPLFLVMLVIMVCGGASEMAMSQWASYFAETGLLVTKTLGDLLGPCSFAVLMGISRIFFAKFEKRINLKTGLIISSVLCIITYFAAGISPYPALSLIACSICGLSVGLMWPGVLSLSAEKFKDGGGTMFALLAFAGDIGCTIGPFSLSIIADASGDLKTGFLFVIIFPAIMLMSLLKIKNFRR